MRVSPRQLARNGPTPVGFSLVEVVIALGILAFVITALLGAFIVGMNTDRESVEQLEATHILQTMIEERRSNPKQTNTNFLLPPLDIAFTNSSSNAVSLDEIGRRQAGSRSGKYGLVYRVTPSTNTNSSAVYCAIYWPGRGTPDSAQGRVEIATRIALP